MRKTSFFLGIALCLQVVYADDPFNVTVPLDNYQPGIYGSAFAIYRLEAESAEFNLPDTPFQQVLAREVTGIRSTLTLKSGPFGRIRTEPPDNPYTNDTRLLKLDSNEIRQASLHVEVGKNFLHRAEEYVHSRIVTKGTGIPMLSADAVWRHRRGDCTEHAVLLAALLRKKGVPARTPFGMILSRRYSGKENVFVFHMWVEAWDGSRWVLLDATRPGKVFPSRYVLFGYHSLRSETPLSYLESISMIRNLRISLADYKEQP